MWVCPPSPSCSLLVPAVAAAVEAGRQGEEVTFQLVWPAHIVTRTKLQRWDCLPHPPFPHPSLWNLVDATGTHQIVQHSWQLGCRKAALGTQRLGALSPTTQYHGGGALRPRQPGYRRDAHVLSEYGAFSTAEAVLPTEIPEVNVVRIRENKKLHYSIINWKNKRKSSTYQPSKGLKTTSTLKSRKKSIKYHEQPR